jgi:hypothetical protein
MQSSTVTGSAIEPVLRGCVFNPFTHLSVSISLRLKRCLIWLTTYVKELKKHPFVYDFYFGSIYSFHIQFLWNILLLMRDESAFLHESSKHTSWNMLEWDVFSFSNPYNSSSTSVILPASVWLCAPNLALVKLRTWNPYLTRSAFLNIFIKFSSLIYWIYSSPAFPNLFLCLLNFRKNFWNSKLVNSLGFRSLLPGYDAVGKQR